MAETKVSDHLVGQVRVMTVPEERLFCVTTHSPMQKLDEELDRMIHLLEAAREEAGSVGGPVVIRYFATDEEGIWQMDVGVQVTNSDWLRSAGEAQIVELPALRCGALLHWGSLKYIGESYEALNQGIAAAGLKAKGEGREWHLQFVGDVSDNNVILLQLEVVST
jgi:effector-binding domain-containing protein